MSCKLLKKAYLDQVLTDLRQIWWAIDRLKMVLFLKIQDGAGCHLGIDFGQYLSLKDICMKFGVFKVATTK